MLIHQYLFIKHRAVKQGVDFLNQAILILLEFPSRILLRVFQVTQETSRYFARRFPAKVSSTELCTAGGRNERSAHMQVISRETGKRCRFLFLPAPYRRAVPKVPRIAFFFSLSAFSEM